MQAAMTEHEAFAVDGENLTVDPEVAGKDGLTAMMISTLGNLEMRRQHGSRAASWGPCGAGGGLQTGHCFLLAWHL